MQTPENIWPSTYQLVGSASLHTPYNWSRGDGRTHRPLPVTRLLRTPRNGGIMKKENYSDLGETIKSDDSDFQFASEVKKRSGTDFNMCYHCWCCTGGCPFSHAMDYTPNGIIRLVQFGLKRKALESSTIWLCVGCNTCSTVCPMRIDMSAIMDTMRQMALEEGISVAEPDILNFHKEVLHSIEHYGRTHKLEIMLRYKIRKRDWFSDMDVGLKMLAKRKLDLMPSKVNDIGEIRKFFTDVKHKT